MGGNPVTDGVVMVTLSALGRQLLDHSGSPIRFFNPVILTQIFAQPHNPDTSFQNPTCRAYFQSHILPTFLL